MFIIFERTSLAKHTYMLLFSISPVFNKRLLFNVEIEFRGIFSNKESYLDILNGSHTNGYSFSIIKNF